MRSYTSFFDSAHPDREIRVVGDEVDSIGKGKKKIQIFENLHATQNSQFNFVVVYLAARSTARQMRRLGIRHLTPPRRPIDTD